MALQQPTSRQLDVAMTIVKHQDLHNQSPTLKEIAAFLGIASVSGIHGHCLNLVRKGWLTWQPHSHRSLQLTEPGLTMVRELLVSKAL
jgi:SOS-response transcriptional repressor LexA